MRFDCLKSFVRVSQKLFIVDLQEYWNLPRPNQFDLSQVPHLKNLKVNVDVLQKLDDPLPWLSALLQTGINSLYPTQANAVRSIWIVCIVPPSSLHGPVCEYHNIRAME